MDSIGHETQRQVRMSTTVDSGRRYQSVQSTIKTQKKKSDNKIRNTAGSHAVKQKQKQKKQFSLSSPPLFPSVSQALTQESITHPISPFPPNYALNTLRFCPKTKMVRCLTSSFGSDSFPSSLNINWWARIYLHFVQHQMRQWVPACHNSYFCRRHCLPHPSCRVGARFLSRPSPLHASPNTLTIVLPPSIGESSYGRGGGGSIV